MTQSGGRTSIVLVGAGHAHVEVIRAFGLRPPAGADVTIVTDRLRAPYSGMLPGCIAGDYGVDEIHIDVAALAARSGCQLVEAEAVGVDRAARLVLLKDRPPIPYGLLSINIGVVPDLDGIAGAEAHAVPVKPVASFLRRLAQAEATLADAGRARRIVVIGGGAAGIELAFAFRDRWPAAAITLVAGGGLAPALNGGIRRRASRALGEAGVAVVERDEATAVDADAVTLASGRSLEADAVFVSTAARPPSWLDGTGLPRAADGGIAVRPTLQVSDDPSVFAAGDCATMADHPRPRAGVLAVRQGPVLARNLAAACEGHRFEAYRPQSDVLTILRTGPERAIAGRGRWPAVEGAWVWRWKRWIDQRFMARYA
jgi:pyridine nucleotide-disulfide oxidoreductase family protein